jgi:hypothetical protein
MSGVIEKYASVQVHLDRDRTIELQTRLGHMERTQMDTLYCGERRFGHVMLMDSPGDPACVLEVVVSPTAGDSIATLYRANPVFNTREDYMDMRRELVELVEDLADAGPGGVAVQCPVRMRPTNVRELGCKQLLEIIAFRARKFATRH